MDFCEACRIAAHESQQYVFAYVDEHHNENGVCVYTVKGYRSDKTVACYIYGRMER